jgi:hypothetical protein
MITSISDESRPPSANKGDQKKGKPDTNLGRSSSMNPRHPSTGIFNIFKQNKTN